MKLQSIFNRFHKKKDIPLNILTIPTDELFNIYLGELPYNFWYFYFPELDWNNKFGKIPQNFHKLDFFQKGIQIPSWLDINIILCQNSILHKNILEQYSNILKVPLIEFDICKNNCVNLDIFKDLKLERQQFALLIYDNWANKAKTHGYYIWEKFKTQIPTVVFGKNIGISREVSCLEEAIHIYNQAYLFVNLTLTNEDHLLRVLEAMACGCPIVSVKTQLSEKIIKDGENGYLSNNFIDLVQYSKNILSDKKLFTSLSDKAKKTACEFNHKILLSNLQNKINEVYEEYILL